MSPYIADFLSFATERLRAIPSSKSEMKKEEKPQVRIFERPCKRTRTETKATTSDAAIAEEKSEYNFKNVGFSDMECRDLAYGCAREIQNGHTIRKIDFSDNPNLGAHTAYALRSVCVNARNDMEINLSGCSGLNTNMAIGLCRAAAISEHEINFIWPEQIPPVIATTYRFAIIDKASNMRAYWNSLKLKLRDSCSEVYYTVEVFRQKKGGNWKQISRLVTSYHQFYDNPPLNIWLSIEKGDLLVYTEPIEVPLLSQEPTTPRKPRILDKRNGK